LSTKLWFSEVSLPSLYFSHPFNFALPVPILDQHSCVKHSNKMSAN